jgi:2-oxoglutarate dehydrogenase E2 component (dihydrolipoamide succinyltransferase)
MPTDVVMPQMGESIAEGTIVRWIKKVGDQVARDEPLFEISTDKVDAEIPSPAAGVVAEIRVQEGETVPVNSVVAVIGPSDASASDKDAKPPGAPPQQTSAPPAPQAAATPAPQAATEPAPPAPPTSAGPTSHQEPAPAATAIPAEQPAPAPAPAAAPTSPRPDSTPADVTSSPSSTLESRIRQRSSPLVRKIAEEHHVDISAIHGTGIAGRVTKGDILDFIARSPAGPSAPEGSSRRPPAAPASESPGASPPARGGAAVDIQPMSVMRKKIAEHMIVSRRTSAHVHSVFEVNFSRVAKIRDTAKAEHEKAGAKLTYMSFIIKAVCDALRAVPIVNASIDGDNIVYHRDVNVGIAVALDWGLIVPVIKKADERNLLGLSRAVADLANRARAKQLKPEDVADATFTITNPGVFGALFGMPIISQPQVAILGVGNIEKRPVVIDDAIAIRPMAYLTLGYDHRLIDGAVADQFMSHVKRQIEHWDSADA